MPAKNTKKKQETVQTKDFDPWAPAARAKGPGRPRRADHVGAEASPEIDFHGFAAQRVGDIYRAAKSDGKWHDKKLASVEAQDMAPHASLAERVSWMTARFESHVRLQEQREQDMARLASLADRWSCIEAGFEELFDALAKQREQDMAAGVILAERLSSIDIGLEEEVRNFERQLAAQGQRFCHGSREAGCSDSESAAESADT